VGAGEVGVSAFDFGAVEAGEEVALAVGDEVSTLVSGLTGDAGVFAEAAGGEADA